MLGVGLGCGGVGGTGCGLVKRSLFRSCRVWRGWAEHGGVLGFWCDIAKVLQAPKSSQSQTGRGEASGRLTLNEENWF